MKRSICFCMLAILMLLGFSSTAVSQFGDPVPRYPQEMDGPVNVKSGALYFSETDIAVPGRGLGIEFTRYYNSDGEGSSAAYRPSYVGYKWSHSYQWRVLAESPKGKDLTATVFTGSGSKHDFTATISGSSNWQSHVNFRPKAGVRATLELEKSGGKWAFIYTTRGGIRYRMEAPSGAPALPNEYPLTEISDPNGNRLKLHYEAMPEHPLVYNFSMTPHRLVAVEDTQGRILKFYYEQRVDRADDVDHLRVISKIEFGLGTKTALTTVYQTVKYAHSIPSQSSLTWNVFPTSVAHQLGSGDPRGTEIKTQYEYNSNVGPLTAVISPLGYRTEFDFHYRNTVTYMRVRDVPSGDSTDGVVQYCRRYSNDSNEYSSSSMYAFNKDPNETGGNQKKVRHYRYRTDFGLVTHFRKIDQNETRANYNWNYSNGNVTSTYHYDDVNKKRRWQYKIYYAGSNPKHNSQMGNPTKWEQVETTSPYTAVIRKWEADYKTKFNRPIWQIDPMGHKTTFTYDTKGNLTEQRSKANTGTQPHAVSRDIVTTHTYDKYGNRTKTTFMPGTTQEKVVETVYDSTHHTYPVEVKTTVTVDGAKHTIKTKSEWDVNRGLKTADIDAAGRRTEYAYWKDRALKYTRRVADDLYTVPTYDKNGNVTQTQVRQNNWQTGTIIAQTKTEYDAMNRAVKAHSFKDNWTTPYATTETVYDIFGDVSQTKDPRGLITNYTLDGLGRVTKQTLPDGDWVETRYNSLNQVTKAWTSQNGTETNPAVSNTYDNLNRLSKVSYKTGESVGYTYDLGNNTLTQKTNDGANTYTYTFTHDQLNRVKTRNDSLLGYKTFYEYDDASMRTRFYIQPAADSTKTVYDVNYTYDEADRLLSVTDALASKTASYAYFDIGALKTATLPNGVTAHRTLDNLNRLDTLKYKKDASTTLTSLDYTYDTKSNVTKLVRNDTGAGGTSKTFTFGYDGLSRLTSANYGDETVSYTYDKSGNRLTQVSSVDGTTTYTVASNSNQLTYRSLVPEDTDFATMNYTYDAEGKLTQRSEGTDSDAFTYGFGSQLTQIKKTRNNAVTQTLSYAYDGSGQRVKATDSRGTRYFLYDGLMPVLELDSGKKVAASYLYGAGGVVYRHNHAAGTAHKPIARWHFDEGSGTAASDTEGTNHGTLGGGETGRTPTWNTDGGLSFDGVDDAVKVPDSDSLDLAGDTLTISVWVKRGLTMQWLSILRKADDSNGYQLSITPGGTVEFKILQAGVTTTATSHTPLPFNQWQHLAARYDGAALRIFINGKIETNSIANTAASGALAATTEALWIGGGASRHYLGSIDDLLIYGRALPDENISYLAGDREALYAYGPPNFEYHHTNALGSNILITDGSKNVAARYEYDVFGAVRSETGTSANPRKFTGKEYESDVKLYYFAARYYDPHIGRFTQRDPAGDGINWYAYTYNNPLKYTDPTGEVPVDDQAGTVDEFLGEFFPEGEDYPRLSDFGFTNTGNYDYRGGDIQHEISDSKSRYIYTQKYGWIDMKHFLASAAMAAEYRQKYRNRKIGYNYAMSMGDLVEIKQFLSDGTERDSAFSYEDLPSNAAGASFGAYYYNPNSGLSLGDQIATWLNTQGASAPEAAPNYDLLAPTAADIGPSHIHRNFTYKPFNLYKLRRD